MHEAEGLLRLALAAGHRGNVIGLTTAAGIRGAAAVGMGFGFGLYILSAGGTVIMLTLLRIIGRMATPHDARPAIGSSHRDASDVDDEDGEPA